MRVEMIEQSACWNFSRRPMKAVTCRRTRAPHLLLAFLLAITILYSGGSWAAGLCTATNQPRTASIGLPLRVVPHSNTPVGALITPWFSSVAIPDYWTCVNPNQVGVGVTHTTTLNRTSMVYTEGGVNFTVYETGFPGVGVVIGYVTFINACGWRPSSDIGTYAYRACSGKGNNGTQIRVALVRTGQIANGGMVKLGTVVVASPVEDKIAMPVGEVSFIASDVEIIVPPCTVSDVTVSLPTVHGRDFKAIGTKAAARDFSLLFKDCPVGLGSVKYQFEPTTAIVDANNGVVELSSSSTAKGIGLQMLDANGVAIKFNHLYTIAGYDNKQSSSYSIPLKAGLYQTKDKVTGGGVTAKVLFTLHYE